MRLLRSSSSFVAVLALTALLGCGGGSHAASKSTSSSQSSWLSSVNKNTSSPSAPNPFGNKNTSSFSSTVTVYNRNEEPRYPTPYQKECYEDSGGSALQPECEAPPGEAYFPPCLKGAKLEACVLGNQPDLMKHEFGLLLKHYSTAEQLDVLDREGCDTTKGRDPESREDGWPWREFMAFLYEHLQSHYNLPLHKYLWKNEAQRICPGSLPDIVENHSATEEME